MEELRKLRQQDTSFSALKPPPSQKKSPKKKGLNMPTSAGIGIGTDVVPFQTGFGDMFPPDNTEQGLLTGTPSSFDESSFAFPEENNDANKKSFFNGMASMAKLGLTQQHDEESAASGPAKNRFLKNANALMFINKMKVAAGRKKQGAQVPMEDLNDDDQGLLG